MQKPKDATALATVDAALMSHLAYAPLDWLRNANAAAVEADETMPDRFSKVHKASEVEGKAPHHLTEKQAAYLNKNFELLNVKDFGDAIHAVTVRDKRTGVVFGAAAWPGRR